MAYARDDRDRRHAPARPAPPDTRADKGFDRFTRLAMRLLGVPVALVSLGDGERQNQLSAMGLQVRETSLSSALCRHVVRNSVALVVGDARQEPSLGVTPVTVDLGVVAYAGMPIADPTATPAGPAGRLPRPSDDGAFREQLVLEITRARRHRRPLSVALIDLDHFTQINDRHGREAADVVLDEAADRLKAVIKDGQTLARVGGDTFAWIVPAATEMAAASAVRRIVRAFASASFTAVGVVTISAGVAEIGDGVDADGLYTHAADALEHAKRTGRDRVCRYFNRPALQRATISASAPSAERGSSPRSARRTPGARRGAISVSPRRRPR